MGISRENRARQFLPFDALKGLQEALREKEIELDERKELSEESIEELSNNLQLIERGDNVRLTYYHQKKAFLSLLAILTRVPKMLLSE